MPNGKPSLVLDTNTVLDWLVFRDPAVQGLVDLLQRGSITWIASPAMRVEFDHVLRRPALASWQPDESAASSAWSTWVRMEAADAPRGPLLCTDPDDQVFIDLALHRRCTWLVTRDRALLRLARRAAAWGVVVTTPQAWSASTAHLPSD